MSLRIYNHRPITSYSKVSYGDPVEAACWRQSVGFGYKLCDVDDFAEKVLYLNSNRQQVKQMGQNARRIAEEKFDRNRLAFQALEVITSV